MSSREVYRRWVLGVIVIGVLGIATGCTEAERRECYERGYSAAICEGGGGGGPLPGTDHNT